MLLVPPRSERKRSDTRQRMAVTAILKTIFSQETKTDAETQWEAVADALREKQPKLGALMDTSRDVARRYMSLETLARITDNPTIRLPAVAA